MDFTLTEEQDAIVEVATQVLGGTVTHERLKELERSGGDRFLPDVWQELAKANLLGIALPEAHGGTGFGILEACLVLREIGRTCAPVPYLACVVGAAMPILALAGAPSEVFIWVAVTTAFVGMLTHANIEMRCGPLNYIFNTPVLHRWHHSTDLREGNKNYGEVLIIYDLVFGTYINPDRRPPTEIGITEAMPAGFWQQLWAPFWWTRLQKAASDGLAPRLMSRPAPSAEPSDASTAP